MYQIKSFNNVVKSEEDVKTIRTQVITVENINYLQQTTVFFPVPFTDADVGTNPIVSIAVQSDDIYSCNIDTVTKSSVTFSLFPVILYAVRYRYFKFTFFKTAGANLGQAINTINLGRIRFYTDVNREITIDPLTISSSRILSSDPPQNLFEPTGNPNLMWVSFTTPLNGVALNIVIRFLEPVSICSYEFITTNSAVKTIGPQCVPGSWNLQASNDEISYTLIHSVDKFAINTKISAARNMFQLPLLQPSAPISCQVIASL